MTAAPFCVRHRRHLPAPHPPPTAQPTIRPLNRPNPSRNKEPETPHKSSPSNPWVAQPPLSENTPPVRLPPLPAAPPIFPPSRLLWTNWPPLLLPSKKPFDVETAEGEAAKNANQKAAEVMEEPATTLIQIVSTSRIRKTHPKALQNPPTSTSLYITSQRGDLKLKPKSQTAQRRGQ